MKLLRIKINSEFSSLEPGFELQFRSPIRRMEDSLTDWLQFQPFCFAGLNGSGKSNVLEALANIFFHLECCVNVNHPGNFKDQFSPAECRPDAFELEYYIKPQSEDGEYNIENIVLVSVVKEKGKNPEMNWKPYPFDQNAPRSIDLVARMDATIPAGGKNYLPDLVIGYSSGENETLSIPFLKARLLQFDEYKEAVRRGYEFNSIKKEGLVYEKPESNLVYIDYEMSQAVLLANYLFQDKETVLKPLEKLLGIVDIKRFRMNLNIGHELEKQPILKQYERTLEKFKKCSTASFHSDSKLWLDFWINADTKKAFQQNFKGGIFELFQAFQILYTLSYRITDFSTKSDVYESKGYYTQGKVSIPGPSERVFYFLDYYISKKIKGTEVVKELLLKQLSDGEQQFLHSLGICLMLKNKRALLLLDEPETHFNPDWRSRFISILGKSLTAAESNNMMRDVLVTSHSPFIISDCLPDKVIYFRRNKDNPRFTEAISAREMNFNSFGASVDIILEVLFGKRQTIGNVAKHRLQYDLSVVKTKDDVDAIKEEISELGESIEKDILLAALNELKFD
jgi:restriction system-associated AAA family ATPase